MVNSSTISLKVLLAFLVLEAETGLTDYNRIDYLYDLMAYLVRELVKFLYLIKNPN